MNPSKAWNAKLESGFFLPSKNLYKQCDLEMLAFPKSGNSIPANSDRAVLVHTNILFVETLLRLKLRLNCVKATPLICESQRGQIEKRILILFSTLQEYTQFMSFYTRFGKKSGILESLLLRNTHI